MGVGGKISTSRDEIKEKSLLFNDQQHHEQVCVMDGKIVDLPGVYRNHPQSLAISVA